MSTESMRQDLKTLIERVEGIQGENILEPGVREEFLDKCKELVEQASQLVTDEITLDKFEEMLELCEIDNFTEILYIIDEYAELQGLYL